MTQICEYCRSRVDYGREECKNCGAPVQKFHPSTNAYNNPHFTWGVDQMNAAYNSQLNGLMGAGFLTYPQLGNIQDSVIGRQNLTSPDPIDYLMTALGMKR